MTLETRLQSLVPFWSWIPAFRAVAETEHLPSAARLLGVGPSTLSRTISLLERALCKPLFRRAGRTLRLNTNGQMLLVAVRDSMRRLEDGVQELAGPGLHGPLIIASSGAGTTAFVAPALAQLRQHHPRLQPQIVTRAAKEVPLELLRGRLDIAFQEAPGSRDGLVTTKVGGIARSIYCGRTHPLFTVRKILAAHLAEAEFVAPPSDDNGVVADGWPVERPRRIALVTDQLRVGLEVCESTPLLAVLPDVLARAHGQSLRRLPFAFIPASEVFATHRRALGSAPSAAAQLVTIVQAAARPADVE